MSGSGLVLLDNDHRPAACPACGSAQPRLVGALRYAADTVFAGMPIALRHAPQLRECRYCRSWFTFNAVRPDDAARLYTEGRGDEQWRPEPFASSKRPEVLAALGSLLRPGAQVVDFGCNTGELLDFCRARGASTTGIELSEAARRVCAQKGHRLVQSLAELNASVDLICAFDLVEHLYDLDRFVGAALDALRSGGNLVVLTGDKGSLTARAAGARWWYARYPEHVLFPSWRYWRGRQGFDGVRRLRTYASVGYRATPAARVRGGTRLLAGIGNGLPLVGPDHHLLMLTKA